MPLLHVRARKQTWFAGFPLGLFMLLVLLTHTVDAGAQARAAGDGEEVGSTTAAATTNDAGPAGIVPFTRGFNASLATSSQHDSSNGWSSVLTPDAAYRYNRFLSLDVAIPIYTYINVEANVGTKAAPVYSLKTKRGVVGDTTLSGHLDAHPLSFDYNGTGALGLPSGNSAYGLGAGQPTYNVNNHLEKDLDFFAPDIEVGIADSSSLINARVRKSFIQVGPVAHFQAGGSVSLPRDLNFEADAFEELPLGDSVTYSTTGRGKKKVTTAVHGPAEDNGFLSTLDVPLSGHVTLSGFYSRSLRNHYDTAGFSFTFLLRAPPREAAR